MAGLNARGLQSKLLITPLLRRYITSARGHELSGRVRAHAYYAWAECVWVTTLVSEAIIIILYCRYGAA